MSTTSSLVSNLVDRKITPQTSPIPGREAEMVVNNAGGFTFALDDWGRLARFLILGAEGNTYYQTEKALVRENAAVVERLLAVDGPRVVREIVAISESGRAPKAGPTLFAFAMCLKLGDEATKREAQAAFNKVARIGTHLFNLATAVQAFGGWGRGTQRTFANWYLTQDAEHLAYGLIKYQSRDGWSHKDVLRLAKPHGHVRDGEHDQLLRWATKGWVGGVSDTAPTDAMRQVWAFERAKGAASAAEIVKLITDYSLPRECIPTQFLNEVTVWEALLDNGGRGMPITGLVRNLPKMTAVGLIKPMSDASRKIAATLTNADILKKGRVHPLQLLVALKTYGQGHGEKGKLTWTADQKVVDALDTAFYLSFGAVTPTNKRWVLGLDVSGSMQSGLIAGLPGVTPAVATGAMALVTAVVEKDHAFCAFSNTLVPVKISPKTRLDDVVRKLSQIPMGGTDCTLPIVWATENKIPVDVFYTLTDNECYAGNGSRWGTTGGGNGHVTQALDHYRQKTGIAAKLVVAGMTSTGFTLADPKRNDQLDVVGFDPSVPEIVSQFVLGKL